MTNHEPDSEGVERLLATLNDRTMPEIDFDRLAEQVSALVERVRRADIEAGELALLREDYLGRINGMLKAVAVAERSEAGALEAADQIDQLQTLGAKQLIVQYRRTAARFRDAFPASFKPLSQRTGDLRNQRRIDDYK